MARRHERCILRCIARLLALPLSTVGRILKSVCLSRSTHLQPPVPLRRYQWARTDEIIFIDSKQLARIDRVAHRITGDRRLGRSAGEVYEQSHVAIDNLTRLAYAEVLTDEKQATTVGSLIRAVAWFGRQVIECRRLFSDNGSAYRSIPWWQACEVLGPTGKCTTLYTP